jgi:hypothetical protein
MQINYIQQGRTSMNKRGTGAVFCLIAAILFASRYITAAIFMSGVSSWSSGLFGAGLQYVGTPLNTFSIISLIVGIGYLLWAEISEMKKK